MFYFYYFVKRFLFRNIYQINLKRIHLFEFVSPARCILRKCLESLDDWMKPWQDKNNLFKDNEPCKNGNPHYLKIIFFTRNNEKDYNPIPDGSVLAEIIYQCTVCGKYYHEKTIKK